LPPNKSSGSQNGLMIRGSEGCDGMPKKSIAWIQRESAALGIP
jgi:hypothetical protein